MGYTCVARMARMEPSDAPVVQALAGPQPGIIKVEASVAGPAKRVRDDLRDTLEDFCTLEVVLAEGVDGDLKGRIIAALQEQLPKLCQEADEGRVCPRGFIVIQEDEHVYLQMRSVPEKAVLERLKYLHVEVRTEREGYVQFRRHKVIFEKPAQNMATREVHQKIKVLKAKMNVIREKYKELGVAYHGHGRPQLPHGYVSKEEHTKFWEECVEKRKKKENLTAKEMGKLQHYKVVDMKDLNAKIDDLFQQEQDALLELKGEELKLHK